jgi:sporulation protein YlmC with PRC-barrel domain
LTYHHDDGDASFFDKFELLHKSVYSTDGKKLGFVKKVFPYNIVIQSEFTWLRKYIVSKSSIAHLSKKDIKLKITAYEVRHRYSYPKVKNILIPLKNIAKTSSTTTVATKAKRLFLEIHESIQYSRWQRNQLAAVIAFVSGIVFLISGYKVNVTFYYIIQEEIFSNLPSNLWPVVIISMEIIVIISRLGGITVLTGAALFAANRVNLGKTLDRNRYRSRVIHDSITSYIRCVVWKDRSCKQLCSMVDVICYWFRNFVFNYRKEYIKRR